MTESFCPWCGSKVGDGFAFCRMCGRRFQVSTQGGGVFQPIAEPPAPVVVGGPGQGSRTPVKSRTALYVNISIIVVAAVIIGAFAASGVFSSKSSSPPSGLAPISNCFGGGTCIGPSGTSNGSGTTCVLSSFSETAGDFLYVAIDYLAGSNMVTSVGDGAIDTFVYTGGEFANQQSVTFYDVSSESGGTVTITVTLSAAEYGTCRAGQLSAGTAVGVVGIGNSTASGTSLSMTNAATHEPSLLLGMIGSTRPSGAYSMIAPAGNWLTGGQQGTGYNPGTESGLYGYNDTASGPVTFAFTTGTSVSISGIVVEFYL